MKLLILTISSGKEDWALLAERLFLEKISHFFPASLVQLKPAKGARESADFRRRSDSEALQNELTTADYVVLFDEKGERPDSRGFSRQIQKGLMSSKKRMVFVIGGPFGASPELKSRADLIVSMSSMTLSHHVALVVALEQIYRGLTIYRGLPYHND